jgi:hypothetical protein
MCSSLIQTNFYVFYSTCSYLNILCLKGALLGNCYKFHRLLRILLKYFSFYMKLPWVSTN